MATEITVFVQLYVWWQMGMIIGVHWRCSNMTIAHVAFGLARPQCAQHGMSWECIYFVDLFDGHKGMLHM
jgi:hypothetical protein